MKPLFMVKAAARPSVPAANIKPPFKVDTTGGVSIAANGFCRHKRRPLVGSKE
jgi:hypothetical protein